MVGSFNPENKFNENEIIFPKEEWNCKVWVTNRVSKNSHSYSKKRNLRITSNLSNLLIHSSWIASKITWATKNTRGPLLSIESWLLTRGLYNGLPQTLHNWVVVHPLQNPKKSVLFLIAHLASAHLCPLKKNSTESSFHHPPWETQLLPWISNG